MRVAVVSDIHDNFTALEAVLADLRESAPDLVIHGGDIAGGGSSPAEVVDRVRDLGWRGVGGNTDEMLVRPDSLHEFAANSPPQFASMWSAIEEQAAWTREALGPERLAWLSTLPQVHREGHLVVVHASPDSRWRAPAPEAGEDELQQIYGPLGGKFVVYGHVHRSYVRQIGVMTVANSGSVSLAYDGDPRASYLLLDEGKPSIRRVEYDLQKEIDALHRAGIPHAAWTEKLLRKAGFVMP